MGMTNGQSVAITEHPDTVEKTEGQRLLEKVSLETSAAIAHRMDYSALHRFSNGDTMEILPRRDGSTQATISRGVEGTVQTTLRDKKTPMCVLYFLQDVMDGILDEWESATAQRLRSAIRKLDPEQRRQVREEMQERGDTKQRLTERALLIATGATDQGPRGYYDTMEKCEAIIDQHILQEDTLEAATEMAGRLDYKRAPLTPGQYNSMVTHPEVMEEADRWDRVAVMIWWHHIADMEKQPPPPGSLEKMIQTIREAIGVAEREWKSLEDLVKPRERHGAPDYYDEYYQGPRDFPMPIYRDVRELVCAIRALNETEQMQGCLELARNVLYCGKQHLDFQEALWEQGNAWDAWLWTLGMIAEHYEHECQREKKHDLLEDPVESFGKALRQHIKENLPWPECSWKDLLIRAREWVENDIHIENELEEALGGAAQVNQAYIHWGPEEMMEEVDQEVRRQMELPESAPAPETRHENRGG